MVSFCRQAVAAVVAMAANINNAAAVATVLAAVAAGRGWLNAICRKVLIDSEVQRVGVAIEWMCSKNGV